jgi:hypothetical protein
MLQELAQEEQTEHKSRVDHEATRKLEVQEAEKKMAEEKAEAK